jgi:hypothetical protein
LSVDIDLTYLPVQPRPESLIAIEGAMMRIAERAKKAIQNVHVFARSSRSPPHRPTLWLAS